MKKRLVAALLITTFLSCNNNKNIPDVSGIKVSIPLERFDQLFFAIDTNQISKGLMEVAQKDPGFYTDFMQQILGVSGNPADTTTQAVTLNFLSGYRKVYDTLSLMYKDMSGVQKNLEKGFQFLKYYFPDYKTGKAIIFIGPFDAPGVALTRSGLAIGLQQYAGKDFSVYHSAVGNQLFPEYISRRFEPSYITANCIKSVLLDMFPDNSSGKPLIEQMIEKGKQWYLLDKVLPSEPDSVKTGYTGKQLAWCRENEGNIWGFLLQTENLNSIEPYVIQSYIGESPNTQGMPEVSPGNIGPWVGWQIVKKFMAENASVSLTQLMKTDPRKILEEAKYKPK